MVTAILMGALTVRGIHVGLMLLCVIGAYSTDYAMTDIWMMLLAFGVLGYVMSKLDIPLPPFVIAFVLGPRLEQSLRRALLLSRGEFSTFVTSPISVGVRILAAIFIVQIGRKSRRRSSALKSA